VGVIEESEYVEKIACPSCGSSDANAIYSDGHSHCFSCNKTVSAKGESKKVINRNLLMGVPKELVARGIDLTTCKMFNYWIGSDGSNPVHIENYYYKNNLISQHIRYKNKDFKWLGDSKKIGLFGQHLWKMGGKQLIITEGAIDALSISKVLNNKVPVVSIPSGIQSASKYIKQNLEFCESFEEIILAFDDDDAGREGVAIVTPLFSPGKVKLMKYCGNKDANELLLIDPNSLIECIFNAQTYRPDGIIYGEDMWQALIKKQAVGIPIPYKELNDMMYGVHKGKLYLFTAASGIGKSTIVKELSYHLMMEHNQKIGVIALEESIKEAGEAYMSIYLNSPINNSPEINHTKPEYKEAYDNVIANGKFRIYDHFGSTKIDNLLSKIRYLIVACGCDWIVLDHISIVVSGLEDNDDERKNIDLLMTKLRSLIQETGVGMLAVVHIKRAFGGGKGFNEGKPVSLTDLRGSASLEQLSDKVIALERNQQGDNPNESIIRLLKNRGASKTGVAGYAYYNEITGRLLPHTPSISTNKVTTKRRDTNANDNF
jgi:twinkle protein